MLITGYKFISDEKDIDFRAAYLPVYDTRQSPRPVSRNTAADPEH